MRHVLMDTGLGMLLLPSGAELGDLCPPRLPSQYWQEEQHAYLRNVQFSSRRSSDWQLSSRRLSSSRLNRRFNRRFSRHFSRWFSRRQFSSRRFSNRRFSRRQFSSRRFSNRRFSNRELINGQLTNMGITPTRFSSDSKPISSVNRSINNVKRHCSRWPSNKAHSS
ncbi:chaperonin-containing T-complex alpha subunit Cct1 [Pestalotiopsis sp. IQ-011]